MAENSSRLMVVLSKNGTLCTKKLDIVSWEMANSWERTLKNKSLGMQNRINEIPWYYILKTP